MSKGGWRVVALLVGIVAIVAFYVLVILTY